MAGITQLLRSAAPWMLAIGPVLAAPGLVLCWLAQWRTRRLLPLLHERHPAAWQFLTSRPRRLFEWSPAALHVPDAALTGRLLRLRRMEHAGGMLLLPGMLMWVLGNCVRPFA
jgi:hypothetical protein